MKQIEYDKNTKLISGFSIAQANHDPLMNTYLLKHNKYGQIGYVDKSVIADILEKPKPKVSQNVMNYYKQHKDFNIYFNDWFDSDTLRSDGGDVYEWLYNNDYKTNQQREFAFATLIMHGPNSVEIEGAKKYKVKMKSLYEPYNYLNLSESGFAFNTASERDSNYKVIFTKQELIDAGFGDVFDNEMFEVEEVR